MVQRCFVPLLRWVLSRWDGTPLTLEATTLGQRFTGWAAAPSTKAVLPATHRHAWRRAWRVLLHPLHPAGWHGFVP